MNWKFEFDPFYNNLQGDDFSITRIIKWFEFKTSMYLVFIKLLHLPFLVWPAFMGAS